MLRQRYDAMGTSRIDRVADELALSEASASPLTASDRGAGRPDVRTLSTAGGPIVRTYDYAAGSSLLSRMVTTNGVVKVASRAPGNPNEQAIDRARQAVETRLDLLRTPS